MVWILVLLLCPWLAYADSWRGEPKELPTQRLPGFPNSLQGHIAFARWIMPLLQERGLSRDAAVLYAAHVAKETTYGWNVWNYNFGNTKTGSTIRGPWMWLTDSRGERDKYRAFQNAQDGLDNNLQLLRGSKIYRKAWQMLEVSDPRWYAEIGLAGYFVGPRDPSDRTRNLPHNADTIVQVQRDYDGTVLHLRECLRTEQSAPPPPQNVLASLAEKPIKHASDLPTWLVCLMGLFTIAVAAGAQQSFPPELKLKIQRRIRR